MPQLPRALCLPDDCDERDNERVNATPTPD
jgi:hypothetical protein